MYHVCLLSSSLEWRALEKFYLSKGIEQGDTISPYIFILWMERLRNLMAQVVNENKWRAIQFKKGGALKISHLFFCR